MSGLFGVLHVGTSGMLASQFGVQTSGENVTNAATPGYSRRRVQLSPADSHTVGGVRAEGSRRVRDQFLDARLLGARTFNGEAEARMRTVAPLDVILADGPGSISDAYANFEAALSDVANSPNDNAARTVLLQRADELSDAFNFTSNRLAETRADANQQIIAEVQDVNAHLEEIADLGAKISQLELSGQEASNLRDRRDELLRKVADAVPIKAIEQPNGTMMVLLGASKALVQPDGKVSPLQTTLNATTGDVDVYRTTAGQQDDVGNLITSGRIAGYLEGRDGALTSARDQLDQLAFDISQAYNAAHTAGFGLDGAGGRTFFDPQATVAGAARRMAVSADVAGQPENIAAAQDPAEVPGDNRAALAMQALSTTAFAFGGTETVQSAYGLVSADAGSEVRSAMGTEEQAAFSLDQIEAMREAISGVSTDEEMVQIMQFQRAYQASIQVIQTADSMLETLLNMR